MTENTTKFLPGKTRIANVQPCDDTLSCRGGLALFARYLQAIALQQPLTTLFQALRKNQKGLPAWETFVQLFCFFADGTSRHLVHFDRLKQDPSHAALLETTPDKLVSSHMVKRFFRAFNFPKALLSAFFLFEAFQEDVCAEAVPVTAYPTTLRRAVIDIAAKFVRHAGQMILKIARPVWDALDFGRLWELANDPTTVVWV